MKKTKTKITIFLGIICALFMGISTWYTIVFNESRFIVPMDLSEYIFQIQDLPMIISGILLALYILYFVVLLIQAIITNKNNGINFWRVWYSKQRIKLGFCEYHLRCSCCRYIKYCLPCDHIFYIMTMINLARIFASYFIR